MTDKQKVEWAKRTFAEIADAGRGIGEESMRQRFLKPAKRIMRIVELVEARCMAADGPVTPTLQEMTEGGLREIWLGCKAICRLAEKKNDEC